MLWECTVSPSVMSAVVLIGKLYWPVILKLIRMFVTLLQMNSITHPTCQDFTHSHITCAKGWYEYCIVGSFTAAQFTEALPAKFGDSFGVRLQKEIIMTCKRHCVNKPT